MAKPSQDRGIYPRGDGFQIMVPKGKDANGKYIYKWETVKGNITQARKRRNDLIYEIKHGTFIEPGKLTVGDYLDKWLEKVKPNLSPKTYETYEMIVRVHFKPEIGDVKLNQLRRSRIADYYITKQKSGLSAQTVVHHHKALHKALSTAVSLGLIETNPSDQIELPKIQRVEMKTYNKEDVAKFLECAKNTEYYAVFKLAFFEGLRRSELLALRWKDIDFAFGTVSIMRSLHVMKGREIIFRQPKTAHSKRSIPLTPSSYLVIKEHYDKCKATLESVKKKISDEDLVFCHQDNRTIPMLPNTISHAWSKIAVKAGLKHIRLHDARHTMATLMLQAGVHPKVVQERLGHSSITVTMDKYSHVTPTIQLEAAKTLDFAFYGKIDDDKK